MQKAAAEQWQTAGKSLSKTGKGAPKSAQKAAQKSGQQQTTQGKGTNATLSKANAAPSQVRGSMLNDESYPL